MRASGIERLSRFWFAALGFALMSVSVLLALYGAFEIGTILWRPDGDTGDRLLTSVGYFVIATAIFEVGKYIVEEEVIRERELRHVSEVRRSLTRFISTVIIIVLLEGLVAVFKVTNKDPALLPYPTLLLITGVLMLVGLGAFQRIWSRRSKRISAVETMQPRASHRGTGRNAVCEDDDRATGCKSYGPSGSRSKAVKEKAPRPELKGSRGQAASARSGREGCGREGVGFPGVTTNPCR